MNNLKAFLDGELDAAEASTIQSQLQSDGSLAIMANDFRRISSSFASLAVGPAVSGRERTMAAVTAPHSGLGFPWKLAGAAASLVIAVVLVGQLFPVFAQSEEAGRELAEKVKDLAPGSVMSPSESEADSGYPRNVQPGEPAPGRAAAGNEELAYSSPELPAKGGTVAPELYERKVVRTGSVAVRVDSIDEAERKVNAYVDSVRGYVENSTSSNLDGESPSMNLVVRIPQAKFGEAFAVFEKLGERTAKDIQSADVTQQIVDIEARLKNLRSQEETYRAILRSTRRVGEIIDVQERLSRIRGEIESMQAQRDSMNKLAALATISVQLDQRPPAEEATGGWLEDTWANATQALGGALRGLSVLGIWILVYAPIWIPIAILSVWGWRRALRT